MGEIAHGFYVEQRRIMEGLGPLYISLKEAFHLDRDSLLYVDPRNQLYLVPRLLRDIWTYRPSVKEALRALLMLYALPAVIVNGRVAFSGGIPTVKEAIDHVREIVRVPIRSRPSLKEVLFSMKRFFGELAHQRLRGGG